MTPNLSVFAIPAYWLLTLAPHSYAVSLILKTNNGRFNNSNSKSISYVESLRKTTPADVYARWERSEAAHRNGMENLPLFVASIVIGNMAGLNSGTLTTFAASYLLLRVVYTVLYIQTTSIKKSYYRSLVWAASTIYAVGIICCAGYVMM